MKGLRNNTSTNVRQMKTKGQVVGSLEKRTANGKMLNGLKQKYIKRHVSSSDCGYDHNYDQTLVITWDSGKGLKRDTVF